MRALSRQVFHGECRKRLLGFIERWCKVWLTWSRFFWFFLLDWLFAFWLIFAWVWLHAQNIGGIGFLFFFITRNMVKRCCINFQQSYSLFSISNRRIRKNSLDQQVFVFSISQWVMQRSIKAQRCVCNQFMLETTRCSLHWQFQQQYYFVNKAIFAKINRRYKSSRHSRNSNRIIVWQLIVGKYIKIRT